MKNYLYPILAFLFFGCANGQDLDAFDYSEEWLSKIEALIPANETDQVNADRDVLVFSLHTGFEHWTIPHTEAVISSIAKKSIGYRVTPSKDIFQFEKDSLAKYDVVVLNNTCSNFDTRNMFYDKLQDDTSITDRERLEKSIQMEKNLLNYVRDGGGLVVLHGGIVMQNKSSAFGRMVGGTFDYHPMQQSFDVKLVDPEHPLVKGFKGEGFTHVDEPYIFSNAYFDFNFRPLLYMEDDEIEGIREPQKNSKRYIAWIKKYGDGRVFYSSPSHNAQSYDNPKLLLFLRNGLLYATGDLECDDSPMKKEN